MQELLSRITQTASTSAPVLVRGEVGAGKGLVAEALHQSSPRASGPYVAFEPGMAPERVEEELFGADPSATNGSGSPSPAFERARGGTLFIDEIGDLTPTAQARLVRVLQQGDVRVVAATSRDLAAEAAAGRFSADLLRAFEGALLEVPSLRDRRDDLPSMVEQVVAEFAAAQRRPAPTVSPEAMEVLCQYDWPGNVRELRTVVQRAMSLAPREQTLGLSLLRMEAPAKQSGTRRLNLSPEWKTFKEAKDQLLEQWENDYLREVLGRAGGNMTLAARYAGIARGHLYRLLKKHGLVRANTA